jgi:predicted nuclease of predicted toxin-antitoxin system
VKFKLDENMPLDLMGDLTALGHDADSVMDEGLQGEADPEVVAAAHAEGRILLTLDKGIGDLRLYPASRHAGIVVFRPGSNGRGVVLAFVRERLSEVLSLDLPQTLTVVGRERIRRR